VGSRIEVEVTCQIIAQGAKCIVVNVEYRLAPEHKLPAGLNDACEVTKWVLDNKISIGGGRLSKVGVSGDSAGGGLAAGVAHDVKGLAYQVLAYPSLSVSDTSFMSAQEYKSGPVLNHELLSWFEQNMADVKDWRNPKIANLLRDKFNNLPPCLFISAQCDPLRDQSYEYAKKLTAAQVPNELYLVKGAIHGFYAMPAVFVELCKEAHGRTIEFIKKHGTHH